MNMFGIELETISTLVVTVGGAAVYLQRAAKALAKPIRETKEQLESLQAAMRVLLKSNISRYHREFTGKGWIDRYTKELVKDMQEQYMALGGNGFVAELIADIDKLPVDTGRKEVKND